MGTRVREGRRKRSKKREGRKRGGTGSKKKRNRE